MCRLLVACALLVACGGTTAHRVDTALRLFSSAEPKHRFEAVVRLGGLTSSKEARAALRVAVGDEDHAVRLMAAIGIIAAEYGTTAAAETSPRVASKPALSPSGGAPLALLTSMERLVYGDPWFAGTLVPAVLVAARDRDRRVHDLAIRALKVIREHSPTEFRAAITKAIANR